MLRSNWLCWGPMLKRVGMRRLLILTLLILCGCTQYHAEVPIPGSDRIATVDMTYFLQKKDIKLFKLNLESGEVTLENFGTDTSEVVQTLVDKIP